MTSPDQVSTQSPSHSGSTDVKTLEDALATKLEAGMRKIQEDHAMEMAVAAKTIEQHKYLEVELREVIALMEVESENTQQIAEENAESKESIKALTFQIEQYKRAELELYETHNSACLMKEDLSAKVSELESHVLLLEKEKQKIIEDANVEKEEASKALAAQIELNSTVDQDLQEALSVLDQEEKGLQWEEKCRGLKKCNLDLTNEVTALKETLKKQWVDAQDVSAAKKKMEIEFNAQRDADAKLIKDLEKKGIEKQMAKKRKEQDEWEATDRQMQALDTSLEQARKVIRQEFAQRIKELEDKLRDADGQQNGLKSQLAAAQRELATSKRKAKKIQQGSAQSTEKVLLAPESSNITPMDELKKTLCSMSLSFWGVLVVALILMMEFLPSAR